ncbi:MAG: HlyC/CorC family transporter [Planctomycetes bacterium]|nr:HlyC/CorC family transporter [Planctomycetota bacterium]
MLDISVILFLTLLNGVFAMSELAMFSAQKTRLRQLAGTGNTRAVAALSIREHPTRFLSTVQLGITLVGILSGALGGATLAEDLAESLRRIPILAPYAPALALALIVMAVTYVSVTIGEIIPKRIALVQPERLACAVAPAMNLLARVGAPFVRALTGPTDALLRVAGVRSAGQPSVTEEDIKVLIQQGAEMGVVDETEHELVKSVFNLAERSVGSMMTPRPDIVWLDLNDPVEENRRKLLSHPYSRFPVARGSLDQLVGVVDVRDLLGRAVMGLELNLELCIKHPLIVPESASALQLLEQFKESPVHVALVADEYGGIEGLVTRIDVVEALVGELPSHQEEEPEAVRRPDGSWLLDGIIAVEDFRATLGLQNAPEEDKGEYKTLAGFVMAHLGRVPVTGAAFEWNALRFEVVDMDRHRIDKVLVTPLPKRSDAATWPG